ncbi:STAS domain-containing protein [Actinoplanes solisilvae]|uniref:STAS domain-containing protein n=1 Tax=Actinoplanes solisilvae TaxID=2486853 RepID=UPI000FDAF696|nr:STAS domain-containing protein [Actinoplanes solisilvae]
MNTSTLTGTTTGRIVTPSAEAGGAAVVELHGDIDLEVVELLHDCVTSALEHGSDVLVELADVTLMDGASLSALVQADQLADRRGCTMCLVAPTAVVRRTLACAGLGSAFVTFGDREQASRALRYGRQAAA